MKVGHLAVALALFVPATTFGQGPEQTASSAVAQSTLRATFMTKDRNAITDWKPEEIIVRESGVRLKVDEVTCGTSEPLAVGILMQVGGWGTADSFHKKKDGENYKELLEFAHSLAESQNAVFVSVFDESVNSLVPLSTGANSFSVNEALLKLQGAKFTHFSKSNNAVLEVLQSFPAQAGRKVLIVLGDFTTTDPKPDPKYVAKLAAANDVQVFTLFSQITDYPLHSPPISNLATLLPIGTGGKDYSLDYSPVSVVLADLKKMVSSSCKITFEPQKKLSAGQFRNVKVRVSRKMDVVIYSQQRLDTASLTSWSVEDFGTAHPSINLTLEPRK